MVRNRSTQCFAAATALTCCVFVRHARAQRPSDVDVHDLVQQAVQRVAPGSQVGSVPAAQVGAGNQPSATLSLEDTIKLTLDRNLNIAVQRLNPEVNDLAYRNLFVSSYHPVMTSTLTEQSATSAPTSVLTLGQTSAAPVAGTLTYNAGLTENVYWGGGTASAAFNNYRQTSTSNTITYNPLFNSTWSFAYTQPVPLLSQNVVTDPNREAIWIQKVNKDMSDTTLRATIENTVANVENAYWEYAYAVDAVRVAQDSVAIAHQLVVDNQTRVDVGTMTPLDTLTAQSQEAAATQLLVAAQSTRRNNEIALKQFIVGGTDDPNWNVTIVPNDHPDFAPQPIDLDAAVRQALSQRTDLELSKQTLQINDISLRYLGDQLKPTVNLVARYQATGIGGPALERGTSTLGSAITQTVPGGIGNAFSTLFGRDYPTWSLGLTVSYPFLQNTQQVTLARARVQESQVRTQLKQQQLQVATEVTTAVIAVDNAVQAVQAGQVASDLAQREYDAEQAKFDIGTSTNYNVVLAQQTLSTAKQSLLRAIANYREALVGLDRAQKTTLTTASIQIVGR
ncbi:MAG TPA: TolC family protein [Vicinamibacterales bacterium]|nr:TolC family protein [Vicinamibacterales bacterium]